MSHLLAIILLSIIVCYHCGMGQETSEIWQPLAYLNCAVNDQQLLLLRIFFSRVSTIEATELLNATGRTTRFAAHLVRQLSTSNVKYLFIGDDCYKWWFPDSTAVIRTFSITAEPRDQDMKFMLNPVRQIDNFVIPRHRNLLRREESAFGSIIYTDSLESFESIVLGPSQHPFNNPDGIYLILLTLRAIEEDWQQTAASLLQVLWYKWHIMHAILLSTCDPERVSYDLSMNVTSYIQFFNL